MSIIALVGSKGAGKNTAALALQKSGYTPLSFAAALKNVLAAAFCWPRHLLEGDTAESREWREQVDLWWSNKLGIYNFTPRRAMELVGTEALRHHFNNNLWVLNIERQIDALPKGSKVVLTDARYPNEIALTHRCHGRVWEVRKKDRPAWYELAKRALEGDHVARYSLHELGVHDSEYAWMNAPIDATLFNDGSIEDLHIRVQGLIENDDLLMA